jgi:hypothetical protein
MIYSKKTIFTLFICFIMSQLAFGQKNLYTKNKLRQIENFAKELQKNQQENNQKLQSIAQNLKVDIERVLSGGKVIRLKGLNQIGEPIFTITESNFQAGQTTRTNSFYTGGSLGLGLSGAGASVAGRLGVWDGGKVQNNHDEFGGRVQPQDNTTGFSTHSTHVAGTMVAAGLNSMARGMAPSASIKAWDFSNDDAEMAAASKDLLISNHSYGQIAGWVFNETRTGNQKWEWYGNTSINDSEDYKFGIYDNQSQNWDRIAYNAPNYLIVKSVGNKRNENGPGLNSSKTQTLEKYYLGSSSDTSRVPRSQNNAYDIIPTYGVAKNILTVGAVNTFPEGPLYPSQIKISSFSSWGPTDDGRIKPDLVGVGVNLFSPSANSNSSYTVLSGTSMSSPQVAGSLLLLQELYSQQNQGKVMRSSTLKGLALHTATDAGNQGPDYIYGWGLLNMEAAGKILLNTNKSHYLAENTLLTNDKYTQKVIANGTEPLVVTICWTDPEAEPTAILAANVNSRFPKLINDLDITVTDGQNNYQAWVLDPEKPSQPATKGNNIRDNVEQVHIANPIPGTEYTISIGHKSALIKSQQEYALLLSGIGGISYCASKPNSQGSKIQQLKIGNLNYTATAQCAEYSKITSQIAEARPNQSVDFELLTGTCNVQNAKQAKFFADWNHDGDFADTNEKIYESVGLQAENIFAGKIKIPANQKVGQTILIRAILSEETNPVQPCGNYNKGETLDFALKIISPKVDLSVVKMDFPSDNFCANSTVDLLSIQLNNAGSDALVIDSLRYQIFENEQLIIEKTKKINESIEALSSKTISLEQKVVFNVGKTYKFVWQTYTATDENFDNNLLTITKTAQAPPSPTAVKVLTCDTDGQVSLSAGDTGSAFWYNAPVAGSLLGVGNMITLPAANNAQYYASLNDLNGVLGPKSKGEFGGGTYSGNFGPKPIIHTKAPIVLESARLYIGHSGKITFTVERLSDLLPIAQITLNVRSTRDSTLGNAANGQQLDDPHDPGAIYHLGLSIPEPGQYQIAIDYDDGASIYRSNIGVEGFPYSLQSAVEVVGSSFNNGVLTAAWYYFYNLKVRSAGCPSAQRVPAQVAVGQQVAANITSANTVICPSASASIEANKEPGLVYLWYKDGSPINTARSAAYQATQPGLYHVQVSKGGLCPNISNKINITQKNPSAPIIGAVANVLTASEADSYQWYYQLGPIEGATQKTYSASKTGAYSVKAVVEGCALFSPEYYVIVLANEPTHTSQPKLYPNPASNIVFLEYSYNFSYKIINPKGQVIQKGKGQPGVNHIAVAGLPAAKYFIEIETSNSRHVLKLNTN